MLQRRDQRRSGYRQESLLFAQPVTLSIAHCTERFDRARHKIIGFQFGQVTPNTTELVVKSVDEDGCVLVKKHHMSSDPDRIHYPPADKSAFAFSAT